MQLFGTDVLKTWCAHDIEMTSMRRHYVASTSVRRHVPAGNLPPPWPPTPPPPSPQYSKPSYAYVIRCGLYKIQGFMINVTVLFQESDVKSGPEVIKLFSCSTELSMKSYLLINVKMPTIVGILTFWSRKNSIIGLFESKKS